MGVLNTKQRFLGNSLNFSYKPFHLGNIDDKISKGFELVKTAEVLRCKFIPLWNEFIKTSGAIVIADPHFETGINGMILKFANDLNGGLVNNLQINPEEPYVNLTTYKEKLTSESLNIMKSFISLCEFGKINYENVVDLDDTFNTFYREIGVYQKEKKSLFEKMGCSPNEVVKNSKQLNKYLHNFKNARDYVGQMLKNLVEIKNGIYEYEEHCKNEDTMKKFEKIGKEANRKGITLPSKIMYKYSPEKKMASYEDSYDRLSDFIKIDKNAKHFLEKYKESQLSATNDNKENLSSNIKISNSKKENKIINKDSSELPKKIVHESNKENIPPSDKNVNNFEIKEENKNKEIKNDDMNNSSDIINPIENLGNDDYSHEEIKNITNELTSKTSSSIQCIPMKPPFQFKLKSTVKIFPDESVSTTVITSSNEMNLIICGLSNGAIVYLKYPSCLEDKVDLCHTKAVSALLYLNDQKVIISGGKDGKLYKHSLDDYESTLLGEELSIDSIMNLRNDGELLISSNGTVICYNYKMENKTYSFIAHEDVINEMIYYSKKDMLFTCSKDKIINIWKLDSRENIGNLKGMNDEIKSICLSLYNDELIVISASRDGKITYWNLDDKTKTKVVNADGNIVKLFSLYNDINFCLVYEKCSFDIIDLSNTNLKYKFENKEKEDNKNIIYQCGCYLNNGSTLLMGTNKASLIIWENEE